MHCYLSLTLGGMLFSFALQADTTPNNIITDRPSSNRPELPGFVPNKKPSFALPPVEEKVIPKSNASNIKIQLKVVEFSGNTVVSNEQLQKIAQPFIGTPIFVNQLEELRQKISEYYSDQGYMNSGAVLPDQNFKDGIIRLQIIEGKLKEIRVTGTEWLSPDYISDRLQTDANQPLNITELRQRFQLLLLDPLIERMNASLIPGTQRGESILDIAVTRARPYQLMLSTDNYRPPSIGSQQGKLSGWIRNLTGFGDTIDGSVVYSEGSLGGSGGFSVPLNAYDTRFHFHFDINNASVIEEPLKQIDIKSEYLAFEFGLVQPLIQSLNRNFSVGVSFNVKENQTFLLGFGFPFSPGASSEGVTKDSVLRFSLDFTERLEKHVFSARSTTSVGINAFGATWHQEKNVPDSDFVAWLGQVQYAGQFFDDGGTLILRGDVQYTDNVLMPMERFSLGGRYSVRGYRENELVRDKGYVVSAEYRYPLFQDESKDNFLGKVTLFPFMDYGEAWNRGEKTKNDYLHSVGIGLEWQPVKYFHSEIMFAHALKKASSKAQYDLQDSGVHWRVTLSAF
jgi:hemolysin activation/secretion protein